MFLSVFSDELDAGRLILNVNLVLLVYFSILDLFVLSGVVSFPLFLSISLILVLILRFDDSILIFLYFIAGAVGFLDVPWFLYFLLSGEDGSTPSVSSSSLES